MKKIIFLPLLMLAGCASTDYAYRDNGPYNYGSGYDYAHRPSNNYHDHLGTVVSVRYVEDRHLGAGAVVGSIVGGLIGNQVGSGSGRTAATVGGALAGGAIGHHVQQNRQQLKQVVDVRLDGGETVSLVQGNNIRFVVGQRVRVMGTGSSLRLVTEGQYRY